MDDAPLLIFLTLFMATALFGLALLRYRKRGLFLDPLNSYLLNGSMYFMIQVPFIFFPGNLYMIGVGYPDLWPAIWPCFSMEVAYIGIIVGSCLFLSSSYVRRDLSVLPRRIVAWTSLLFTANKLYLLFLIPVVIILAIFVSKFGAALLLIDQVGAAKARTLVLREGAHFRFLFNFASMALSTLLLYLCILSVKLFQEKRILGFLGILMLFLAGCAGAFIITGTRTGALSPLLGLVTMMLMFSRKHNRPIKVLGAGLSLILVASVMDALRSEGGLDLFLFNIFFKGNSFADFRDFVWAYHSFHEKGFVYWNGNTYFASWLSFIPSSFFPFRETWAFGRAILRVVGISSEDHFGIRSGLSGGVYFNGGVLLVLGAAFFQGAGLFFEQRLFHLLFSSKGTLFGKLMFLFIGNKLLSLTFFFLNYNSLWVLYINILIFVGCLFLYPILKLRMQVNNAEAQRNFPA